jgi:hypothetical protein
MRLLQNTLPRAGTKVNGRAATGIAARPGLIDGSGNLPNSGENLGFAI